MNVCHFRTITPLSSIPSAQSHWASKVGIMGRIMAWATTHKATAGVLGFLVLSVVVYGISAAAGHRPSPSAAPATEAATTTAAAKSAPHANSSSRAAPVAAPRTSSSSPSPRTKPSTTAPRPVPAPSKTCSLPNNDLIVRYVAPGTPDSAQVLGGADLATCTSTLDELQSDSPAGAGYCTQAAWAADNPGYNADLTPAPPLKHIVLAVGSACGQ
jgi:hypothetical protein